MLNFGSVSGTSNAVLYLDGIAIKNTNTNTDNGGLITGAIIKPPKSPALEFANIQDYDFTSDYSTKGTEIVFENGTYKKQEDLYDAPNGKYVGNKVTTFKEDTTKPLSIKASIIDKNGVKNEYASEFIYLGGNLTNVFTTENGTLKQSIQNYYDKNNELSSSYTTNYEKDGETVKTMEIYKIEDDSLIYSLHNNIKGKTATVTTTKFDKDTFEVLDSKITYYSETGEPYTVSLNDDNNTSDNTNRNGAIDVSYQRETGDCWLLSGINAISYTDTGKEIIKNALEYDDNGVTVHLAGVGKDYYISNDDIQNARYKTERFEALDGTKLNKTTELEKYSKGDDDMLVFELAVEQLKNDLHNGELVFDFDSPVQALNKTNLIGGTSEESIYYLTGKKSDVSQSKEETEKMLDEFISSCKTDKNIALSFKLTNAQDTVEGYSETLYGPHVYSVKTADDNNVTFINPWDSGEDITVTKEAFLNLVNNSALNVFTLTDLSDKNPSTRKINKPVTEEKINDDGTKTVIYKKPDGEEYKPYREKIFNLNNECISEKRYDGAGNEIPELAWDMV